MYRFYCILRVIPMTDDVGLVCFRIHPSVPHDLMSVECVFLNAHGIRHPASAVVFLTPMMSVGVGENNLGSTGADSVACSGTFTPIVIPTINHNDSKLVLIAVVIGSRLSFVKRSVSFFMERITVFIPIFS